MSYRDYLHEFANNECGIENFEFIVSERVQVNALTFLLFKLNTNYLINESEVVTGKSQTEALLY